MWKITYRGPADLYQDFENSAETYWQGVPKFVSDETKDRIVDRTYRVVARDSWDAEPADEHSTEVEQALNPPGFSEEEMPAGGVFEHVTVHQE